MLWIIHEKEKFAPDRSGRTWRMLAAVHRFESGDAAMKRFVWTTEQLGEAQTKAGLDYMIDGHWHWFTTAHAMPQAKMMAAEDGFRLVLHRESSGGENFVKVWELPPGNEEIMRAIEWDARRNEPD